MNLTTCPDLSLDACARRLDRLRAGVRDLGAGAAILHEPDVIRWAIGTTSPAGWPAALIVTDEAAVALLFGSADPASIATDQMVMRGIRCDRPVRHHEELDAAAAPSLATLARRGKTVAIDVLGAPAWIASGLAAAGVKTTDLTGLLLRLLRRKESDELAIIAHNVALAEVAYRAAEKAIRPGATELAVYHAIIEAVETTAGTSVHFGGDFMAGPGGGEAGGPPSLRVLAAGDSFVIDYFPRRGGYWADMCRTYPIGEPGPRLREAIRVTIRSGCRSTASRARTRPGFRSSIRMSASSPRRRSTRG